MVDSSYSIVNGYGDATIPNLRIPYRGICRKAASPTGKNATQTSLCTMWKGTTPRTVSENTVSGVDLDNQGNSILLTLSGYPALPGNYKMAETETAEGSILFEESCIVLAVKERENRNAPCGNKFILKPIRGEVNISKTFNDSRVRNCYTVSIEIEDPEGETLSGTISAYSF